MSILVGDMDCGEDPSIFVSMADAADSDPESTGSVADVEKPTELVTRSRGRWWLNSVPEYSCRARRSPSSLQVGFLT